MRFSRQGYWSGLPFPSPGDLPNPGVEPRSPILQADSLLTELQGKPRHIAFVSLIRHILIKLTKTKHKEILLKVAREKQQITYKGNLICLAADLSAETLQARREWQDIFKVMKGENLQPRLLYLARISFKINGNIKSFQTSKNYANSVP